MTDLEQFHQFIDTQLTTGGKELSPEQCLELWRAQQQEREQTNEAIRRGLEDLQAGRGLLLQEFITEFQQKNGIKNV